MIAQFDFDGTLALGNNLNLEHMYPNQYIIDLCNKLFDDGNKIVIATARGSKSCNTQNERIEKYKNRIVEWLSKHNVKYHELSFNKEYADIYIDDRAYNIDAQLVYEKLDFGFTANKVRRFNNQIIKQTGSALDERKWFEHANNIGIITPKIYHTDIDTITLSYINGKYSIDYKLNNQLLKIFQKASPTNNLEYNSYIDRIQRHIENNKAILNKEKILTKLKLFNVEPTFNHGDYSITNLIYDGNIVLPIDPIHNEKTFQSYEIDIAKNLFSILFYLQDAALYKESLLFYSLEYGIAENKLKTLIAAESIRVATYNQKYNDISNNLIEAL